MVNQVLPLPEEPGIVLHVQGFLFALMVIHIRKCKAADVLLLVHPSQPPCLPDARGKSLFIQSFLSLTSSKWPGWYLGFMSLSSAHFKSSQWRKGISSQKRSCCSATLGSPAAIPPSSMSQRRRGGWFHFCVQLSGGPHDPAHVGTPGKMSKPGSCLPALGEQALNIQVVGKVLVCTCR